MILAPKEERRTGAAAPIAMPRSKGSALSRVITPVTERAWRIPTAAEADCRSAVKRAPTRIPRRGLDKDEIIWMNFGESPSPLTAELIMFIPIISTEKPSRISPEFFMFCRLPKVRSKIPMTATIPVSVEVERSAFNSPPPSI